MRRTHLRSVIGREPFQSCKGSRAGGQGFVCPKTFFPSLMKNAIQIEILEGGGGEKLNGRVHVKQLTDLDQNIAHRRVHSRS